MPDLQNQSDSSVMSLNKSYAAPQDTKNIFVQGFILPNVFLQLYTKIFQNLKRNKGANSIK